MGGEYNRENAESWRLVRSAIGLDTHDPTRRQGCRWWRAWISIWKDAQSSRTRGSRLAARRQHQIGIVDGQCHPAVLGVRKTDADGRRPHRMKRAIAHVKESSSNRALAGERQVS